MKKNLVIFIFFCFALNAYAQQPVIKVFAFEQQSYPGAKPANAKDENGNSIKKAADKTNYFLFMSFKKTYSITPDQIYIKGHAYQIQTTATRKTPVEYAINSVPGNPQKQVLVPKTGNKVIEIRLAEMPQQKQKAANVQQLVSENDIVIRYKWNNKKYFIAEKKLKKIEPVYNE